MCGVRLRRCILVLIISIAHMLYIRSSFLSLGDWSLEEHYTKFRGTCEKLNICEPISRDTQVMPSQCKRLQVTRFPFGLPASSDSFWSQLFGEQNFPSFSEVFSHLGQAFVSDVGSVSQSPSHHSALATMVSDSDGSSPGFSKGGRETGGGRHGGFDRGSRPWIWT